MALAGSRSRASKENEITGKLVPFRRLLREETRIPAAFWMLSRRRRSCDLRFAPGRPPIDAVQFDRLSILFSAAVPPGLFPAAGAKGSDLAPGTPNAWVESRHKTYPSVFIFGDSFATYWSRILPDVTRRLAYVRHDIPFPTAVIEREKPDLVIYEVIEAYMIHVPKPLTPP
jgi:hypothetical protein